jgi:TonB-linked SusC/RagA family outer membrane protein
MRKIASLLTVLMLFCALAYGQVRTVTGTVRDNNGQPVPFATVTETGTRNATTSDANGVFRISIQQASTLTVTSSGFTQRVLTPGAAGTQDIVLESNGNLSEVVVTTALGIQRQRKELGYATAKVTSEQLTQASPVNVANGLQGKVSGLNVTSVNNGVFEDVKINLRGIRSLTGNNNPMLLLDGVPTPLAYLSSLNPNDIQDVTVLKGSASAALYGPDARNGVIVVTTRKGGRGGQPVITLSHTTQAQNISFFPEFQTQFGSGGYGTYIPYENWSWGPAYDGTQMPIGRPLPDGSQQTVVYSALPDERKKFFNTGLTNQTDISFGAKDFYLSAQDVRVSGITPDDMNRRTGVRLNTSREYGKFRAGFNVNYIQTNYDVFDQNSMEAYNSANNVGLNGGLLNLIFNTPAHIPITSYKDFTNNKWATYNNYFNDYGLNPYFAIDNWRQEGRNDDLLSNLDLSFKATDWMSVTWRGAAQIRNNQVQSTSKGEQPNAVGLGRGFTSIPGAVGQSSTRSSRISSDFFVNFNKTVNDFRLNAIVGHYFRQSDARVTSVGASNLVVPELFNVGNRTGELNGGNSITKSRLIGAHGTVGVSYKGWANVEITGRNDWTSLLAIGNNSFFYPGVSASLVLSDAVSSIKNSKTVSYLKLRGSWNKAGNADISTYILEPVFGQASGFPYGSLPGYTAGNATADPNLQPEFIESKEVGFEIGFLRNRLNLEMAYYSQDNTNQIIPVNVSDATGYTSATVNAASFINKGLEVDLRLTPLFKFRKGNIDIRANAHYNTSEVRSIYEGLEFLSIGGFGNAASNFAVVNHPAFILRATDYLRDDQGRVIVDAASGYPTADPNLKNFGRVYPLWTVGINPTANWNGLTFSVVGEYKGGHYAYNRLGNEMAWTGVSKATAVNNRERFVFPNSVYWDGSKYVPNTNVTVENVNDFFTGVYRAVQSNFITSAASWRIREVSLGYDVPVRILGNQNVVKALNLTLNARNLFIWVPETQQYNDPDFNFTTGNAAGISTAQIYPATRTFGANLTVTF